MGKQDCSREVTILTLTACLWLVLLPRETGASTTTRVYIQSKTPTAIGKIAVQVTAPTIARYSDGASVVVMAPVFLTSEEGFQTSPDFTADGLVQIAFLPPGVTDASSGVSSAGTNDYGGPQYVQAFRDVIKFASGKFKTTSGKTLKDLVSITVLTRFVGVFAFSHPGIGAANVFGDYGAELTSVRYFVGRENPTVDTTTAIEVGYVDTTSGVPVTNPLYSYPAGYSSTALSIDYSSLRYDGSLAGGRPYFDLNGDGTLDSADHALSERVPSIGGKRLYSAALTQALIDNGALTSSAWPSDLMNPSDAATAWATRSSPLRYSEVSTNLPNLMVMLVFARQDHVQAASDKPHVHQAYDGFRATAGLWTRLNPDREYATCIGGSAFSGFPDTSANREPSNWSNAYSLTYSYDESIAGASVIASRSAVSEMSDRAHDSVSSTNLSAVLNTYSCP